MGSQVSSSARWTAVGRRLSTVLVSIVPLAALATETWEVAAGFEVLPEGRRDAVGAVVDGDDRSASVHFLDPPWMGSWRAGTPVEGPIVHQGGGIDALGRLLGLFGGGAPPTAPFPECGLEPLPSGLSCARFPPCS